VMVFVCSVGRSIRNWSSKIINVDDAAQFHEKGGLVMLRNEIAIAIAGASGCDGTSYAAGAAYFFPTST